MTNPEKTLDQILSFVELTHGMTRVERMVLLPESNRYENDAEHTFQLALMVWYVADLLQVDLNRELLFKFALVHDLVEVYAGDVSSFADEAARKNKVINERAALEKITQLFPEWPVLPELIHAYEAKDNAEANFVSAIDKLLPTMNVLLAGGKSWKEQGITLAMLRRFKEEKMSIFPQINQLFEVLLERCGQNLHLQD
jgi:putative hydrolases of HD superfamily